MEDNNESLKINKDEKAEKKACEEAGVYYDDEIPLCVEKENSNKIIKNLDYYQQRINSNKSNFFKIFEENLINIKSKTCKESELPLNLKFSKTTYESSDPIITIISIEDFNKFTEIIEQLYDHNKLYKKFIYGLNEKFRLKKKILKTISYYLNKYISNIATKISLQEHEIKEYEMLQKHDAENSIYENKYKRLSFLVESFRTFRNNLNIIELLIIEAESKQNKKNENNPIQKSNNKIASLLIGLSIIKKYEQDAELFVEKGKIWSGSNIVYKKMDEKETEIMLRNNWVMDIENDNRWLFKVE